MVGNGKRDLLRQYHYAILADSRKYDLVEKRYAAWREGVCLMVRCGKGAEDPNSLERNYDDGVCGTWYSGDGGLWLYNGGVRGGGGRGSMGSGARELCREKCTRISARMFVVSCGWIKRGTALPDYHLPN